MVVSSRLTITNKIIYMNTGTTLCHHSVSDLHHQLMYIIVLRSVRNLTWRLVAPCIGLQPFDATKAVEGFETLMADADVEPDSHVNASARFSWLTRSPDHLLAACQHTPSKLSQGRLGSRQNRLGVLRGRKDLQIPVEMYKEVWCVLLDR